MRIEIDANTAIECAAGDTYVLESMPGKAVREGSDLVLPSARLKGFFDAGGIGFEIAGTYVPAREAPFAASLFDAVEPVSVAVDTLAIDIPAAIPSAPSGIIQAGDASVIINAEPAPSAELSVAARQAAAIESVDRASKIQVAAADAGAGSVEVARAESAPAEITVEAAAPASAEPPAAPRRAAMRMASSDGIDVQSDEGIEPLAGNLSATIKATEYQAPSWKTAFSYTAGSLAGAAADGYSLVGDSKGTYGTIEITPDGKVTYIRNGTEGPAGGTVEEFTYRVMKTDGDYYEGTIKFTIPEGEIEPLNLGTLDLTADRYVYHPLTPMNVSNSVSGTDPDGFELVGSGDGAYGSLFLDANGCYTYIRNGATTNSAGISETFTFRVQFEDGVVGQGTVRVAIPAGAIPDTGTSRVEAENDITMGTAGAASGKTLDPDNPYEIFNGDGQGKYGTFSFDESNGQFKYDRNDTAGPAGGDEDAFLYRVNYTDGTYSIGRFVFRVPEGQAEHPYDYDVDGSSFFDAGKITFTDGSGKPAVRYEIIDGDGAYGMMTIGDDGAWRFDRDTDAEIPSGGATERFTYRAWFESGSYAEGEFVVTIPDGGISGLPAENYVITAKGFVFVPDKTISSDRETGDDPFSLVGTGTGRYGTMAINPDGTFSYTRNGDIPGEEATEIFTYRVQYADGTFGEGQIKVIIPTGEIQGKDSVTINCEADSFDFVPAEKLSGENLKPRNPFELKSDADGEYGTITFNSDGSWSYSRNGAQAPEGGATDEFSYRVYYNDGTYGDGKIVIRIPEGEIKALPAGNLTGECPGMDFIPENVLSGEDLADDPFELIGDAKGTYGTLTLNPDGSWSYLRDGSEGPAGGGQDTFTYRVHYANGKYADGTITMKIPEGAPAAGTAPTINCEVPGFDFVPSQGLSGENAESFELVGSGDGAYGTLAINPDGTWSYVRNGTDGPDGGGKDEFSYRINYANGTHSEGKIVVSIPEGEIRPIGINDVSVDVDAAEKSGTLSFPSFELADDDPIVLKSPAEGDYGTLALNDDGSWTYVRNSFPAPSGGGEDRFTFRVMLADGRYAEGEFVVSVPEGVIDADAPDIIDAADVAIDAPDFVQKGTVKLTGHDNASFELADHGQGSYGRLTLNPDGSWTYERGGKKAPEGGATEEFAYRATLPNGDIAEGKFVVSIPEGGPNPLSLGDVRFDLEDGESGAFAAPDKAPAKSEPYTLVGTAEGTYGKLEFNPDGSWTYVRNETEVPKEGATDEFTYRLQYADGTYAEGKLIVSVPASVESAEPLDPVDPASISGVWMPIDIPGHAIKGVADHGAFGKVVQENGQWYYVLDRAIDSNDVAQQVPDANNVEGAVTIRLVLDDGSVLSLPIDIMDDVPRMSLVEGGSVSAGMIAKGAGLEFSFGADDWAGGKQSLQVFANGTKAGSFDNLRQTIEVRGEHGTLTIKANGQYSYKADPWGAASVEGAKDVFTFRLADADGDIVTSDAAGRASMEFAIEKPSVPGLSAKVSEGDSIIDGQGVAIAMPRGYTIVDRAGGYDGESGYLEKSGGKWIYHLDKAISHDGEGADWKAGADTVVVRLQDRYGNIVETELKVDVQDDVPEMGSGSQAEVGAGSSASGQIDINFGADNGDGKRIVITDGEGAKTEITDFSQSATIAGAHGALTLDPATGKWSYAAKADGDGTDRFAIEIIDADGDRVSTDADGNEVAIEVTVKDIGNPDDILLDVDEHAAIIDGRPTILDIPDGWSVVSGGRGTHGEIVEVDNGDGTKSWAYVLKESVNHDRADSAPNAEPDRKLADTITIRIASNGQEREVDVRITVIDDSPKAEGAAGDIDESMAQADGNVLSDWGFGADANGHVEFGTGGTTGTASEIRGAHGTLYAKPDGTWVYILDKDDMEVKAIGDGESIADTFDFRVYDGDGDSAASQLVVTIAGKSHEVSITAKNPSPDVPLDGEAPEDPSDEAYARTHGELMEFKDEDTLSGTQAKSGVMEVDIPDGAKSVRIGGTELIDGAERSIQVGDNVLKATWDAATGKISYTFEFGRAQAHGEGEDTFERVLDIQVVDADGSEAASKLVIRIEDDKPEIGVAGGLGSHAVSSGETWESGAARKIEFDFGADRGDGKRIDVSANGGDPVSIEAIGGLLVAEGANGTLTVDTATGQYSYTAKEDAAGGTDVFRFSITDSDGDTVSTYSKDGIAKDAELSFTVRPAFQTFEIAPILADEATMNEWMFDIPTNGDLKVTGVVTGPRYGELVEDESGWHYRLTKRYDHADGEDIAEGADSFRVTAECDGKTYLIDVKVDIMDGDPSIEIDEDSQLGFDMEAGGSVDGTLRFDFGADDDVSERLVTVSGGKDGVLTFRGDEGIVTIDGEAGTLTIDFGKGEYSYSAAKAGSDLFSFSIRDSDGDEVSTDDYGFPYELAFDVAEAQTQAAANRAPMKAPANSMLAIPDDWDDASMDDLVGQEGNVTAADAGQLLSVETTYSMGGEIESAMLNVENQQG